MTWVVLRDFLSFRLDNITAIASLADGQYSRQSVPSMGYCNKSLRTGTSTIAMTIWHQTFALYILCDARYIYEFYLYIGIWFAFGTSIICLLIVVQAAHNPLLRSFQLSCTKQRDQMWGAIVVYRNLDFSFQLI